MTTQYELKPQREFIIKEKNNKDTTDYAYDQYKQQCKVVKELCKLKLINEKAYKNYLFKKRIINLKNQNPNNWTTTEEIKKEDENKDFIDFVLDNMNPKYSWLLRNTYLNGMNEDDKLWYEHYFSKTTYYKQKKAAVEQFIGHYFDFQYRI